MPLKMKVDQMIRMGKSIRHRWINACVKLQKLLHVIRIVKHFISFQILPLQVCGNPVPSESPDLVYSETCPYSHHWCMGDLLRIGSAGYLRHRKYQGYSNDL